MVILIQGHLINTIKKKNNVEFDSIAILVDRIIYTHGNPKEVPDFL